MGRTQRKAEVLMRLDDWSIERSLEKPQIGAYSTAWWVDNTKSYVTHKCEDYAKGIKDVYIWPNKERKCWRCGVAVPDAIQTVWIMHNWEVLRDER